MKLTAILLLVFFPFITCAQDDIPSIDSLLSLDFEDPDFSQSLANSRVESSAREAEDFAYAAGVVYVIDGRDLAALPFDNLYETVRQVVSVFMPASYIFRQNSVAVRGDAQGHFNTRVLLMINGKPLKESLYGGMDAPILSAFPLNVVRRIEVTCGPGSVLYGTGAFAGSINILTKESWETEQNINASVGSFGTLKGAASFSKEGKDSEFSAGISYLSTDGWPFGVWDEGLRDSIGSFVQEPAYQVVDYGQENIGFSGTFKKQDWEINAFYCRNTADIFGVPATWKPQVYGIGGSEKTDYSRSFLSVGRKLGKNGQVSLIYNRFRMDRVLADGMPGEARSDDWQLEFYNRKNAKDESLSFLYGTYLKFGEGFGKSWDKDTFMPYYYANPYQNINFAVYTQTTVKISRAFLFLFGSQIYNLFSGTTVPVIRAGLIFKQKNYGAKLLYGSAFRAPTGVEASFNIPGVISGDRKLSAEKIETVDFQFYYQSPKLKFSAASYFSRAEKEIGRDVNGPVPGYINSSGLVTSFGWEAECSGIIARSLRLRLTYNRQFNFETDLSENRSRIPDFSLKADLVYLSKHFSLGSAFQYYTAVPDFDGKLMHRLNPEAEAFSYLSVKTTIRLSRTIKLEAEGKNLFGDIMYQTERVRKRINTLPDNGGREFRLGLMMGI